MAMIKKYLGNKGNYFNEISKWTKDYIGAKDFLGVGESIAKGFEEAMKDAGKSASAIGESMDSIKRVLTEPQEFTFEGTISDTDAIKGILGYGPGKCTISFDAVKYEKELPNVEEQMPDETIPENKPVEPKRKKFVTFPLSVILKTEQVTKFISQINKTIEEEGCITVESYYDIIESYTGGICYRVEYEDLCGWRKHISFTCKPVVNGYLIKPTSLPDVLYAGYSIVVSEGDEE